jgi:O-antigen/teichoic acid export membrane protein
MVWSDKLMLGGLMTSGDVGVYDVIFKISLLMSIPLTSITSVSAPKFAEVYETNDLSRLKKITHNSSKLVFLISLPIFLLFMFFSDKILAIFGSDFLSGIVALYFLLIARFIGAISGIAGNLLQMADRQVIFMRILFIGAILNIGLNYILIPIYGIVGASIASMFSIVFWNFLMVYFVWKEFNFMSIYLPLFKR